VSENETVHCAGTTKVALTSSREGTPEEESLQASSENIHSGCADMMCWGRLFKVRAAATGKARSPTVDSYVWRTVSNDEEVQCSRLRASESDEHWSSSARYDSAVPHMLA